MRLPQLFLAASAGLLLASPAVGAARACYGENDQATLVGVVALRTDHRAGHNVRYPVLKLDEPVCYRSRTFGDAPAEIRVAVVPTHGDLRRFDRLSGHHVTLRGALSRKVTADQPPETLLLFDPAIVAHRR
jgi:hypothetical protein